MMTQPSERDPSSGERPSFEESDRSAYGLMTPPSQPTPGPWTEITDCQIYGPDSAIRPFTDSGGKHHPEYRTSLVALVYGDNGSAKANACLIAAAPDMLAALYSIAGTLTIALDDFGHENECAVDEDGEGCTCVVNGRLWKPLRTAERQTRALLARISGKETP